MKTLVEMPLGDGEVILIEVSEVEPTGMRAAGVGTGFVVKQVEQAFGTVLKPLASAAKQVVETGRNLDPRPDEIAVEYGVSVKADGNAYIASVGAEASFKIALTWKAAK